MERQPPSKILQLKCSMYHTNFCIKYEDSGSPEKSSGTALFCYLYDKNYAFEYITLCYAARHRARLVGPGTRRLAL